MIAALDPKPQEAVTCSPRTRVGLIPFLFTAGGEKLTNDERWPTRNPRLQFGHGGDAVGDGKAEDARAYTRSPLQFGHGGDAVGDGVADQVRVRAARASIRPRR